MAPAVWYAQSTWSGRTVHLGRCTQPADMVCTPQAFWVRWGIPLLSHSVVRVSGALTIAGWSLKTSSGGTPIWACARRRWVKLLAAGGPADRPDSHVWFAQDSLGIRSTFDILSVGDHKGRVHTIDPRSLYSFVYPPLSAIYRLSIESPSEPSGRRATPRLLLGAVRLFHDIPAQSSCHATAASAGENGSSLSKRGISRCCSSGSCALPARMQLSGGILLRPSPRQPGSRRLRRRPGTREA